MFAQKPHLKLVRAQHFTHEKIIGAIVAKFYGAPCQFSSLTNDGLVGIQQARGLRALEQVWLRLFPIRLPLQGTLTEPIAAIINDEPKTAGKDGGAPERQESSKPRLR